MDYGFAPGRESYDNDGRLLLDRMPNTDVIDRRGIRNVQAFIEHLGTNTSITKPVGDLFILSHGNSAGWMEIDLDSSTKNPDGTPATSTTYEVLEEVLKSATPSVLIPDALHCAGGEDCDGPVEFDMHIRGCRIGRSLPFLEKLKEAFGSPRLVTAPKYFHNTARRGSIGREGWSYEFLAYFFELYRIHVPGKTVKKLQDIPSENRQLLTRDEVVDAFVKHDPPFEFIDGTQVPDIDWQKMIPTPINLQNTNIKKSKVYFNLGLNIAKDPAKPPKTSLNLKPEFRHTKGYPFGRYVYNITVETDPGKGISTPAGKKAAREQAFRDYITDPDIGPDNFKSDHVFPVYKRFGYDSVDDFLDGYSWSCSWLNKRMTCTGTRHVYTILWPIVDRATDNVFFNIFPGDRSGIVEVTNLKPTNIPNDPNDPLFLTVS